MLKPTSHCVILIHSILFLALGHELSSKEERVSGLEDELSSTTPTVIENIVYYTPHEIDIDEPGNEISEPEKIGKEKTVLVEIPDPKYIHVPNENELPRRQFGTDELYHHNPLDYADKPCQCVPWWQCKNETSYNLGEGVLDIRIRENECGHYADICCKHPIHIPYPSIRPHKISGCGLRNENGLGFKITGDNDHEAQFGEFPWMLAILTEHDVDHGSSSIYQFLCGGSLIHPKIALTAAHCVHNKKPYHLRVRAGEWDTQSKHEVFPYQEARVKSIITHDEFYSGGLLNDIALLILEDSFVLGDNVDTVCLPDPEEDLEHSYCYVSGWGKDFWEKPGSYQVILRKVELPLISREKCTQYLRRTKLGPDFHLHESFICAGGEDGRDACKGDGGSPLACPIPGKPGHYQQAGIVAWGIGCGERHTPGVYVDVVHFRHWIDRQFKRLDLDTRYFTI